MSTISRRKFVQQSTIALTAMVTPDLMPAAFKPKLSFSTLGCPKWSLAEIIKYAARYKYMGVEIRTIQGELDLNKCKEFSNANISATKRLFADNNLKIIDLGSSAAMHHTEKTIRHKNMDDARRYIELADKLDCPYIRVFPNNLPNDDTRSSVIDLIIAGLNELGDFAKNAKVEVLMESHGDLVKADELLYVMQHTENRQVGLIWDILNAWSVTKEPPALVYGKLKKYIRHVHVKDGKIREGKLQYTLIGEGEAPLKPAIQLLSKDNYKGYYSFEWEKMWHPEIEEPEIAIPHYSKEIVKYF
jgi:sugar phosphate isomerase/epimerase